MSSQAPQQGPEAICNAAGTNFMNVNQDGSIQPIPAIVQKAKAVTSASGTTIAATFASNPTSGNSIIVVAGAGNNGTLTVADTLSNTYTSAISKANSTTFEAAIFYAVNITGNAANTVTVTNGGAAASMAVEIYEVSGLIGLVNGALGQTSSGTGTGTTASTSNIAGPANSIAFAGVAVGTAAQAVTASTGTIWTADSSQNSGGTPSGLFTFGSLSAQVSNSGPLTSSAAVAGSEPWAMVAAIFKPVVQAIEGTVHIAGYNFLNITAAAPTTTVVKTGPGVFHALVCNTPPGSNGTVTMYDNTAASGTKIGTITYGTVTSMAPHSLPYDLTFSTGLTIVTATGAGDYTVIYR